MSAALHTAHSKTPWQELTPVYKREERDQHGCGHHLVHKMANKDLMMPYSEQESALNDKTQLVTNSPAAKQQHTLQDILLSAATNNSESKYGRIYDVPTPYVPYVTLGTNSCSTVNVDTNSTDKTTKPTKVSMSDSIKKEATLVKKISSASVKMECDFFTNDTRKESSLPHGKMNRK